MTLGDAEKACKAKKRYRTQGAADAFAALQRALHGTDQRAYCCDQCGLWHLTTKKEETRR